MPAYQLLSNLSLKVLVVKVGGVLVKKCGLYQLMLPVMYNHEQFKNSFIIDIYRNVS